MHDHLTNDAHDEPQDTPAAEAHGTALNAESAMDGPVTELVEVFPNVLAVLGPLPSELAGILEPVNTGLMSALDRDHVNTTLATLGIAASLGGNLAQVAANTGGLYRMADDSQALLRAGGRLAVKDGQNLGTIIPMKGSGNSIAQARFTPFNGLDVAQTAAALGPALAMLAIQAQLNQVKTLVEKNVELTSRIIENVRREERAQLESLLETVDQALEDARSAGAVPSSLWAAVASRKMDVLTQRKKYRANVRAHLGKIADPDVRRRREYLQTNAQDIASDAFAMLSTLKAWMGYQALAAAVAREAGANDPVEAKHFDSIVATTRREGLTDLDAITTVLDSLTRELRIIVELRGPASFKVSPKRKDLDATRAVATHLLEAVAPLSDALLPVREPLDRPEVACVPEAADLRPYLNVLRWMLEPEEVLRGFSLGSDNPAPGKVGAVVGAAKEKVVSTFEKDPAQLMIAVTDRRVLVTTTNAFLRYGEFQHAIQLDDVRYVRCRPHNGERERRVDLITREENHDWFFADDVDEAAVDSFAALLAESMALPEGERAELLARPAARLGVATSSEAKVLDGGGPSSLGADTD